MILKYLNTNRPSALFLLPLFNAICWLPFVLKYQEIEPYSDSWFCFFFQHSLIAQNYSGIAFAFILSLLNAILVNLVFINSDVSEKPIFIYAFLHILIESVLRNDPYCYSWQIAELLLLGALWSLLGMVNRYTATSLTFASGFLCGAAILLYVPSALFFIIIFFFLQRLRTFHWREWLFPFIGFGIVILFYITYRNFVHEPFYLNYFAQHVSITDEFLTNQITISILCVIAIFSIFAFLNAALKTVIHSRKQKLLILYCFLIIVSGMSILNFFKLVSVNYQLATMEMSLFTGYFFSKMKRKFLAELIFILLIASQVLRYSSFSF